MKNIKNSRLIKLALLIGLNLIKNSLNINENNENNENFYNYLIKKYKSSDKFNNEFEGFLSLDENKNLVFKRRIHNFNNLDFDIDVLKNLISRQELDLFEFYKIYYFIKKDEKNNFILNIIFTSNNNFEFDKDDSIFISFIKDDLKFKKYNIIEFPKGKSFEKFFEENLEQLKINIKDNYYDLLKYE